MRRKIYHETIAIQFVRCNQIDEKNIHESELIDGCCAQCIELYDEFTEDIIIDIAEQYRKEDREMIDFFEIENREDFPNKLKFGAILL